MSGLLLATGLTAVATLIGFALVACLVDERYHARFALFAPSLGLCALMIPAIAISELGLAVQAFAIPLVFAEASAAAALLAIRRPHVPAIPYLPLALGVALGTALIGWPLVPFGLDWVGYMSSDMVNYVSDAQNLLGNGMFKAPTSAQFAMQQDWSRSFWWFDTVTKERLGSDVVLAMVARCAGIPTLSAFMVLTVACLQAMMLAVAGLVWRDASRAHAAVLSVFLVATSGVVAYTAMSCFLGQAVGMPIFISLLGITFALTSLSASESLRYGGLVGLAAGGLMVSYPEFLPFYLLPAALHAALTIRRDRAMLGVYARASIVAGLAAIIAVNVRFESLAHIIFSGRFGSFGGSGLFNYTLVPSAVASFWSLSPLVPLPAEPLNSILILFGLTLTASASFVVARQVWERDPVSYVTAAFGVILFACALKGYGYAELKAALFITPFLIAVLSVWVIRAISAAYRWPRLLPLAVVGIASVITQQYYVGRSAERDPAPSGTFVEVAHPAATHLVSELAAIAHGSRAVAFVSDTTRRSLAVAEALQNAGRTASFPFSPLMKLAVFSNPSQLAADCNHHRISATACTLAAADLALEPVQSFDLRDGRRDEFYADHRIDRLKSQSEVLFLATTRRQSVLNLQALQSTRGDVVALPYARVSNRLIFINSKLGDTNVVGATPDRVTYFAQEPDFFFRGGSLSAVGRYLLFEVVHPTATLRLSVAFTASLIADGTNAIPPVSLIGTRRARFHAVGAGSARLVSDPVVPQRIAGHSYVLLDFGRDGRGMPESRSFVMRLWGRNLPIDSRRLVGFVRDISLQEVDPQGDRNAPSSLRTFPRDLSNARLVYSGLFEDGWLSRRATAVLRQEAGSRRLTIRGSIPTIEGPGYSADMTVLVDGSAVVRQPLAVGPFEIVTRTLTKPGNHRVEIAFSRDQRLPNNDGRAVAAHLDFLGFE